MEIKVGDRVRVNNRRYATNGCVGIVTSIDEDGFVTVYLDKSKETDFYGYREWEYYHEDLEKIRD